MEISPPSQILLVKALGQYSRFFEIYEIGQLHAHFAQRRLFLQKSQLLRLAALALYISGLFEPSMKLPKIYKSLAVEFSGSPLDLDASEKSVIVSFYFYSLRDSSKL